YELIRAAWQKRWPANKFEEAWHQTVHDGLASLSTGAQAGAASSATQIPPPESLSPGFELLIRPDPHVLDGRYANHAWLQELPKPISKLTWENAAHLSPATAAQLKIKSGDLVELAYRERTLTAPAHIIPGHADQCVTIHLGYGRSHAGTIGNG